MRRHHIPLARMDNRRAGVELALSPCREMILHAVAVARHVSIAHAGKLRRSAIEFKVRHPGPLETMPPAALHLPGIGTRDGIGNDTQGKESGRFESHSIALEQIGNLVEGSAALGYRPQQMRRAVPAIAAAETRHRRLEPSRLHQSLDQRAFRTVGDCQRDHVRRRIGQFIDMPAHRLAGAEVPPEPGAQPAATARAADIGKPARQHGLAQRRAREPHWLRKLDQQHVGTGHRRDRVGSSRHAHISARQFPYPGGKFGRRHVAGIAEPCAAVSVAPVSLRLSLGHCPR